MSNFHFPIIVENFVRSDEKIQTLAGMILYEEIDFQCGLALGSNPILTRNIAYGEEIEDGHYNNILAKIVYNNQYDYYNQDDDDDDDDDEFYGG